MKNVFLLKLATALFSVLCTTLLGYGVFAADFPANAGTLGAIPDYPVNAGGCHVSGQINKDVTFTVSGITGAPTNVEIKNLTFSPAHTWGGDISAVLIAPNGTTASVFGRIGATTATGAGTASDLAGPYGFRNTADPNIWTVQATNPMPSNTYAATVSGGAGITNPAATVNLDTAFAGVAAPNGTWTLRLRDGCDGDTGGVSAVTLTVDGPAALTKPNADFTGDGKTDFSMVRDNTPALAGNEFYRLESVREKLRYLAENPPQASEDLVPGTNLIWFINNSISNADTITSFGQPTTDFIVPSDYDGDGKADIAIWRPGAPTVAAFYILQSSTSTVRMEPFGQTGDDPAITGDYDGDGKSDIATYRCPPIGSPGQCFFFYKGSNANPSGNITYVPWGFGQQFDFFVNPGDFDGDGRFDFCIQRTTPGQSPAAQFILAKSGGGPIEYINWGLNTDLIIPGDYDGDGKYDFMVSRTVSGNRHYWLLTRTNNTSFAVWGITGDVRTPGDYDGDGKTDIAIWRPSTTPSMSTYYVRRSSNGALQTFGYGNQGDGAVPGWNVH
ncbi:MAG: FG-GAP repeat domain-containing protein [Pyrinomonadaceae bacterium]